ncbi:MAG: AtpZ/AtpI family protein [bacterium]|nr:AtpZ/AtpI family protein [bacterium]
MPPEKKKMDSFIIAFGTYGAVGFQLAISVVAGLFIGSYLDKKFNSSPWLTLVGLLLGSVGGFYNLLRIIQWKEKKNS